MVPRLEEVDTIATDKVNDAVFLRQTARPGARREVLQGLWFTDALEGIANDRLDKVKGAERDPSIRFDPVPQVFAELRVKNRCALAPSRWSVSGATASGGLPLEPDGLQRVGGEQRIPLDEAVLEQQETHDLEIGLR